MMAAEPEERFPCVKDVLAAITESLGHLLTESKKATSHRRPLREALRRLRFGFRRHRSRLPFAAAAASSIVALAAISFVGFRHFTATTSQRSPRRPRPISSRTVEAALGGTFAIPTVLTDTQVREHLERKVSLYPPYPHVSSEGAESAISVMLAIKTMLDQAGIRFDHAASLANTGQQAWLKVRPDVRDKPCSLALEEVLNSVGLTYDIRNGQVVLVEQ